jgi:phosphatidate cytidylyltransferase
MPAARRPPSRSTGRGRTRAAQQPRRSQQRSRAAQPRREGSDLLARILVAVPAAILAIVFIDIGGLAFALFMIAIGWLCLYELYRALERWRPLPLIGFASLAGMVLAARYGTHRDVMEVAVATLPVLFLFSLGRGGQGRLTVTVAGTLLGVFWIGFAFAHAVLLRELPHGGAVIIDVLIGTFLGDTAAYAGGRLFGRTPLAPQISPNKTVEGLFCGMLIAVVSVFLAGLDSRAWLTQGDALLLGVAVAVLGPLGDLFESAIKRDAGIKDAGSVFGAHGGALDRLDAVIFTIVAGYYIWVAVMH